MIFSLLLAVATPPPDFHIVDTAADKADPRIFIVDTNSIKVAENGRHLVETFEGFRLKGTPFVTYMRLEADCEHHTVRDATSFIIAPDGSTYSSGLMMGEAKPPVAASVGETAMEVACGDVVIDPAKSLKTTDVVAYIRKWLNDAPG